MEMQEKIVNRYTEKPVKTKNGFVMLALILVLFFGSIADDVFQAAMIYFTITAISYPFLALYNAGAAIFRSVGNSEVSMRVSVIMNITNIVGNAFCIFVLRMGVAGVAVPTLVSRVLGAVIILKLTTRHDNVARVTWDGVRHLQPQMAKNILYIGIPSALENSLFQLGRVLVVSMISLFGTVQFPPMRWPTTWTAWAALWARPSALP